MAKWRRRGCCWSAARRWTHERRNDTPLHIAAQNGHVEATRLLLERGAAVDARQEQNWTPLHVAAQNGHVEAARLLLERGAAVDARQERNSTPLHIAAWKGQVEAARLLLERGAAVDARNNHNSTALLLAAEYGHVEAARLLLERGAAVDAQDNNTATALIFAAWKGRVEVVQLLLQCGADTSIASTYPNPKGTALQVALREGHQQVVTLLQHPEQHRRHSPLQSNAGALAHTASAAQERFYRLITEPCPTPEDVGAAQIFAQKQLELMLPEVSFILDAKLYCTYACLCVRTGLCQNEQGQHHLHQLLKQCAAKHVTCDHSKATFMAMLKYAQSHGVVSEHEMYVLEAASTRSNIKHDPDFLEMKHDIQMLKQCVMSMHRHMQQITISTQRLEANQQMLANTLGKMLESLRRKQRVDMVVSMIGAVLNAFSYGVGGSLLQGVAGWLSEVVDFSDVAMLSKLAESVPALSGGEAAEAQITQLLEDAPGFVARKVGDRWADQLMEEILKRDLIGSLTIVARVSHAAAPEELGEPPQFGRATPAGDALSSREVAIDLSDMDMQSDADGSSARNEDDNSNWRELGLMPLARRICKVLESDELVRLDAGLSNVQKIEQALEQLGIKAEGPSAKQKAHALAAELWDR